MFLLNAPPLAAFQTQWAPFGCNAPCRVPTSLPQPAQVAAATADVEGAIDSPQSEESSLTVNLEYERIMQKNRKGEINIDRGLKPASSLFQGHVREKAVLIVPAQFKDIKEEGDDFEALALDSDSDDSVDRDIEEAIQEYLKNKGSAAPLPCAPAPKSPNIPDNDGDKVKAVQFNVPARWSPIKMVTSPNVCDSFTVQGLSRCSSPDSVGSDDSFEQSIKEEIEQFLIEKKLQNNASESSISKKAAASHPAAKLKPKPGSKQGMKGPALKSAPESLGLHSKTLKPNVRLKTVSGSGKLTVLRPLPPPPAPCIELSDSSSDDGIEEAIQQFQLEKSRLEGNLSSAPCTSQEKDGKSTRNATSDIGHCQVKSFPPESQKKTVDCRKRKLPNVKPAASQDFTSKRAFHSGDERSLEYKPELTATRRAETAAELMCAEAILDISKAILPSQPESSGPVLQEKPSAPAASPSSSDSSVDSDDSIEQEIRTFLARKAEAESLGATSSKTSPKEQRPEPPKQPSLPNNKAAGTSKGKVNDSKVILKGSPGKGIDSANVVVPLSQNLMDSSTETCPEGVKPHCQAEDAKHHIIQAMESLESSPRASAGKRKMYMKVRGSCSGDKSSSLDSDEDLDSAIKDLLRSKRKLKKRPKDGRPQCKKKVRFGETTTRLLESAGGTEQKDCNPRPLVKSCLVISGDLKENSFKRSKPNLKLKEEKKLPVGNTDLSHVSKPLESKPACASKSIKISSALPDPQDSSSVDSDDSIEQEIRKFLAERARESAELSAAQKSTAPVNAEPAQTCTSSPAPIRKDPRACTSSPAPIRKDPRACTSSPAPIRKDPRACTSSPAPIRKDPRACTVSPAPIRKDPRACTVSPAPIRKDPRACTVSPAPIRKDPRACTVSPAPIRKDPRACTVSPAPVTREIGVCTVSPATIKKEPETSTSTAPVTKEIGVCTVSPATIKKEPGASTSTAPIRRVPGACTVSPAPITKEIGVCTVSPATIKKEPETSTSPAPIRRVPGACTVSPANIKKEPGASTSTAPIRKVPGACTVSSAPIKKEPGVLSSSVTETILQKVREKDRSTQPGAPPAVIQRLYGYKDNLPPVARLQQPTGIAPATTPLHSVIVKRDCIVDQKRAVKPTEKTGVIGSQGNIPVSGNFVAGLKYISGTEQQLLLNVGKTGTARLATDFYSPAGTIAPLGSCQKKTFILEQPKVVQAPAFSLGTPMVRPALYVVTTKVVQETSASLCLPINTATYDAGLNLMSIQYCPGQVAPHASACTAPFSFQQTQNSETMVVTPGKAGEIPTLITKARANKTPSGLLDGESANVTGRAADDVEAGASVLQKDQV